MEDKPKDFDTSDDVPPPLISDDSDSDYNSDDEWVDCDDESVVDLGVDKEHRTVKDNDVFDEDGELVLPPLIDGSSSEEDEDEEYYDEESDEDDFETESEDEDIMSPFINPMGIPFGGEDEDEEDESSPQTRSQDSQGIGLTSNSSGRHKQLWNNLSRTQKQRLDNMYKKSQDNFKFNNPSSSSAPSSSGTSIVSATTPISNQIHTKYALWNPNTFLDRTTTLQCSYPPSSPNGTTLSALCSFLLFLILLHIDLARYE